MITHLIKKKKKNRRDSEHLIQEEYGVSLEKEVINFWICNDSVPIWVFICFPPTIKNYDHSIKTHKEMKQKALF